MNRVKYILLLLLGAVLACAGPTEQGAPDAKKGARGFVTGDNLFGLEAWGDKQAWIVGFEGTLFYTSDGGENWQSQDPKGKEDLYDVCFVDGQTGWIVGKYGTILHTTDSGENWVRQEKVTNERLFDAFFLDAQTGWIVGTMGTILHTTDGGQSWMKQGWDEDRYYNGIYFVNPQQGWISGEYSTMYHTEDGGQKWTPQACKEIEPVEPEDDFPPPPAHLYGIYFQSPEVGWMTGMDGIIIKTEDGGTTWNLLTPKEDFTVYQIAIKGQKGWAIGEKGTYMVSTDGGNNWQMDLESLHTRFWLRNLVFTDENHGWIVGALGTILKTDNGGESWKHVSGISIK